MSKAVDRANLALAEQRLTDAEAELAAARARVRDLTADVRQARLDLVEHARSSLGRTTPRLFVEPGGKAAAKPCTGCGCTDADCLRCIERTGHACHWVRPGWCSACDDLGPPVRGAAGDLPKPIPKRKAPARRGRADGK